MKKVIDDEQSLRVSCHKNQNIQGSPVAVDKYQMKSYEIL